MELIMILLLPLLAAFLTAVIRQGKTAAGITLVAGIANLVLTGANALNLVHGHLLIGIAGWISCNAAGALFVLLTAFVGLAGTLFSIGDLQDYRGPHNELKVTRYYTAYNLFLFSLLAVPLADEIAMGWIALAFTTLFSAFLVSFHNTPQALEAAWKYVVLTSIGAVFALFGIMLLYAAGHQAGMSTFTWSSLLAVGPGMPRVLVKIAFLFILMGIGTKVGLVPFHTWLPDAYSQAPTPVCAVFSGAETAVGLYFIFRFLPLTASAGVDVAPWLIFFGLLSTGTAALLLIQVHDIKRLFAFSTIENLGIALTAMGLTTHLSCLGAMQQIVNHSLVKSFCFFAAGMAVVACGTRQICSIRGLIRSRPGVGFCLMIGGLAISGAPPMAMFMSEFNILRSGVASGRYVVIALLTLAMGVAFCGIMRRVNSMVFGNEIELTRGIRGNIPVLIAMLMVGLPMLLLGLYVPGPVHALLLRAAALFGGQ